MSMIFRQSKAKCKVIRLVQHLTSTVRANYLIVEYIYSDFFEVSHNLSIFGRKLLNHFSFSIGVIRFYFSPTTSKKSLIQMSLRQNRQAKEGVKKIYIYIGKDYIETLLSFSLLTRHCCCVQSKIFPSFHSRETQNFMFVKINQHAIVFLSKIFNRKRKKSCMFLSDLAYFKLLRFRSQNVEIMSFNYLLPLCFLNSIISLLKKKNILFF